MWWTGRGNQVLRGVEWELFCEGLGFLKGMIEETIDDPDDDLTGIAAFDRLQPSQQLAMLAAVGQAIRDEETPAPGRSSDIDCLHDGHNLGLILDDDPAVIRRRIAVGHQ
jgi:hypothetical protein